MATKSKATKTKRHRLRDVVEALDAMAPPSLAQDWDNVGLLVGDLDARVSRALCCIDLMPEVVDEAIAAKVGLVVSYHPPLFRPIARLVSPTERMEAGIHRCIRAGIAIYSHHTALDAAAGGTNDVLAGLCGAQNSMPLMPDAEDPSIGIGRVGAIEPTTLQSLARRLKRRCRAGNVALVGDAERTVERVIVCVGAAGSLPFDAKLEGGLGEGDVIVTGEIRHHDALRILRVGGNAIALSHWSSERPALKMIARRVEQAVPGLSVSLSQADREPFTRV
jgi:dinuclear metal center YbgI/SA1388 family protein